jgi:hypothetical protein
MRNVLRFHVLFAQESPVQLECSLKVVSIQRMYRMLERVSE